jgi:hypothetical protein
MRARDLCLALDLPIVAKNAENIRSKLKRLVSRGILIETEPGLFAQPRPQLGGEPPVYLVSHRARYHFVSLHADCEGLPKHRVEGYAYVDPPAGGSKPLYRCYWRPAHDHFLSTEADCEGVEATNEGRLGYVVISPGFSVE